MIQVNFNMKKFVLLILLFLLFEIKGQDESEIFDKNFVGDQRGSSQYQTYNYYRCRRMCYQMYWPYYERRRYDYGPEWYRKMERNDNKTPQRKLIQLKN